MSLLHDSDYVISHLRATYLETCLDGVGERIIRPTHLYITKGGPRKVNWAASTLISKARPESPPIATDTLTSAMMPPMRTNVDYGEDDGYELSQLRAGVKATFATRKRASTLPDIRSGVDLQEEENNWHKLAKGASTENLRSGYDVDGIAETDDDEGTLKTVYENDLEHDISDDFDDDEELDDEDEEDYDDDDDDDNDTVATGDGSSTANNLPPRHKNAQASSSNRPSVNSNRRLRRRLDEDEGLDEDDGALSGLSEEDDSDIEEELEFAAQQIKRNAYAPDDDSVASESRPPSVTTSPRARRRRDPKRQRSFDVVGSSPTQVRSRPRAMSTRSGNSDLYSPQIPFRDRDRDSDSTGVSLSETLISQAEKPEFGLGLTSANTDSINSNIKRDRSGSLLFGLASSGGNGTPASLIRPQPIKPPTSQKSNLTAAIVAKQATFDNPLEQYIAASGKSERNPVRLKMYMPSCNEPKTPWEALVRPDCSTHLAIGFALYCYSQQNRAPELPLEKCDANYWNLHIVEDDGEPDEDFPALDRTRQISAYSFDEFALLPASDDQRKENERKTPNAKRPTATPAASSNGSSQLQNANTSSTQDQMVLPQNVDIKVFKYPFNEMTSPLFWSQTVSVDMYVGEVLEKLCVEKILDQSMYAFKIASTRMVVDNEMKVGTLQGQFTLELTPKRVITRTNGYVEPKLTDDSFEISGSFSNKTQNVYNALALRGAEDAKRDRKSQLLSSASMVPEVLNTAGYRKYMVWRRQPMSFISRHERILALDGEYVHIMPSEDRTFFDPPKTSSFHISQVLKCKQSRKVPANFKIVVRKDSGPKRYDLEAINPSQAVEIVAKIRSLGVTYRRG